MIGNVNVCAGRIATALEEYFGGMREGDVMQVEHSDLRELILRLRPMLEAYEPGDLLTAAPFRETIEGLRSLEDWE